MTPSPDYYWSKVPGLLEPPSQAWSSADGRFRIEKVEGQYAVFAGKRGLRRFKRLKDAKRWVQEVWHDT